jgi:hypothetical protein
MGMKKGLHRFGDLRQRSRSYKNWEAEPERKKMRKKEENSVSCFAD